ncbi:MAG: hypothetical protein KAT43_03785 [Nanoarchaeota archaeon]|nr:hypothetical protein [Nanoarchaeota archaeon]
MADLTDEQRAKLERILGEFNEGLDAVDCVYLPRAEIFLGSGLIENLLKCEHNPILFNPFRNSTERLPPEGTLNPETNPLLIIDYDYMGRAGDRWTIHYFLNEGYKGIRCLYMHGKFNDDTSNDLIFTFGEDVINKTI